MANLIDELREEHSHLATSFGNLKDIDIATEEGRGQLQAVKSTLLEHLRKENEELFPRLREESFNNLQLQRTLDWFSRDIARISAVLILFLDTYCEGGSPLTYGRDFSRLNVILNALIDQEENIIFNEYQTPEPNRAA